jgi:hypothetical protein
MANLAEIAWDMEHEALRRGASNRELSRGLGLTLTHFAGEKTLTLCRPVVKPGEEEIEICRRLFSVPPTALRQEGEVTVTFRWPS